MKTFFARAVLVMGIALAGCAATPHPRDADQRPLAKGQWACPQCGKAYAWVE